MALLRALRSEWRQRYQLQRIGLYGSTARNQATADSDVDNTLVWGVIKAYLPSLREASGCRTGLLVVAPEAQHLHDPLLLQHLIDEAVLDVDPP